jgi:hypothetical protein
VRFPPIEAHIERVTAGLAVAEETLAQGHFLQQAVAVFGVAAGQERRPPAADLAHV